MVAWTASRVTSTTPITATAGLPLMTSNGDPNADCEHEVKPLRSGYRLCLVYNLTLAKSKKPLGALGRDLTPLLLGQVPVARVIRCTS